MMPMHFVEISMHFAEMSSSARRSIGCNSFLMNFINLITDSLRNFSCKHMDTDNALRMFELKVEDFLMQKDSAGLAMMLHEEGLNNALVVRLDSIITKELALDAFRHVGLLLKALGSISEKKEDLHLLLKHGLGAKVLLWFEAVRGLLNSEDHRNSGSLQKLAEEFYDYFLLLGVPSLHVSVLLLSTMILQLGRLVLESGIAFSARLEAIRTYNNLVESINRDERKLLQVDNNQQQIIDELAWSILTVGDYELQVSISEALCRMTPKKDREQRANRWFPSHDIVDAFCKIQDGDFEVDCRLFLNYINGCHGNQRRVYTFPCIQAFLGKTELFGPKDAKLDHFWIDFNLGSECISFFIDDPQGFLWSSVHLHSQWVQSYRLYSRQNEHEEETMLSMELSSPVVHQGTMATQVQLSFGSQQHVLLLEAMGKVFKPALSQRAKGSLQETDDETEALTLCRGDRSYSKKKPKRKNVLKVLPLSSPSSEDSVSILKPSFESTPTRAEVLFDQIVKIPKIELHRIQTQDSGLPEDPPTMQGDEVTNRWEEPEEPEDSGYGGVSLHETVVNTPRKRTSPRSETSLGPSAPKKKALSICVEPSQKDTRDRAGPIAVHGEEPDPPSGQSSSQEDVPAECDPDLGAGLGMDFSAIARQLQENITSASESCWQRVESEVVECLGEFQQNFSSLLKAVHQHRLLMLQRFQQRVVEQINQLEDMFKGLSNMESQILNFLRAEIRSLASFCNQQQSRLASMEDQNQDEEQSMGRNERKEEQMEKNNERDEERDDLE